MNLRQNRLAMLSGICRALGIYCDFSAIAVQNARVHGATNESLTQRVGELASLNDLSQAVSASLELEHVYDVLMKYLRQHWSIETASLWLARDDTGELSEFIPDAQLEIRDTPTLVEKLVKKTAQRGEPVLLAGAPRAFAILSGTIAAVLGLGLRLWLVGLAVWLAGHVIAVAVTKRDPAFLDVLSRHIQHKEHLTC